MARASSLSTSVAHSLASTRRRAWVLALGAVCLLILSAWWALRVVDGAAKRRIRDDLQTVLNTAVAGVQLWCTNREEAATLVASDPAVQSLLETLVEKQKASDASPQSLRSAPEQSQMATHLRLLVESKAYSGFALLDAEGAIVASSTLSDIGTNTLLTKRQLEEISARTATLVPPFLPESRSKPVMLVAAPVSQGERILGFVQLYMPPEGRFSELLLAARPGESGETYAFDAQGNLLSASRFNDELVRVGLLDSAAPSSVLRVQLRDPGVDLTLGQSPPQDREAQPFTLMLQNARRGHSGANVDGYRDYRGVPVVGTWTWLDKYGFGIATEIDIDEAFVLQEKLRKALYVLLSLLGLALAGLVAGAYAAQTAKRRSARAERMAQELGQYTLVRKLGEGGMGTVYEASHRLLRRPTAIKLIRGEQDDDVVRRFEREVRLTSQLTHPNTIMVYDFGRTAEGIFYYAMEYLEGTDLDTLVIKNGKQPAARVVHFLLQACGSLAEAHHLGLIHRDIKGANLFVCQRGGEHDVLKVLDFGLVKSKASEIDNEKLSQVNALVGTPGYIAPEALTDVNATSAQSDIYSLGVVAYFMLAGTEPFQGSTMQLCVAHMNQTPPSLESHGGVVVSDALRDVVMQCLEKDPARRPQGMSDLAARLRLCPEAGKWSEADAAVWWEEHRADGSPPSTTDPQSVATGKTVLIVGGTAALHQRGSA